MVSLQTPLTTLVQFVDPKTGFLTEQGRTIIQQLINRTGGAIGGTILFAGSAVYGVPTGAQYRGPWVSDPALPVGVIYSQAEMQALRQQILTVSEVLAALVTDNKTVGVIR